MTRVSAASVRPGGGALRAARTLIVTIPSVTIGAMAHAGAGGCITLTGVAVTAAALTPATWVQLSRQRSGGFLLLWLPVCQVVAHGLLEVGCTEAHTAGAPRTAMLAAHAAAVLLTAVILRRGEDAIWRTARWLSSVRAALHRLGTRIARLPAAVVVPNLRPIIPTSSRRTARSVWQLAQSVRRGPPVGLRR